VHDGATSILDGRDQMLDRMLAMVAQWDGVADGRRVFLRGYTLMYANMLDALDQGRFHDPAYIRWLLRRFAEHYFEALEAFDNGNGDVPAVWKCTFDMAIGSTTTVAEDLLLGLNAHINHDLPLTLRENLSAEWLLLSLAERASKHDDYLSVNAVIAETTAAFQKEVVERYSHALRTIDPLIAPVLRTVEWEMDRIITAWRESVWIHTIRLLDAPATDERLVIERDIEDGCLHRAHIIALELETREELLVCPVHKVQEIFAARDLKLGRTSAVTTPC
jgi:hypothetical protein